MNSRQPLWPWPHQPSARVLAAHRRGDEGGQRVLYESFGSDATVAQAFILLSQVLLHHGAETSGVTADQFATWFALAVEEAL